VNNPAFSFALRAGSKGQRDRGMNTQWYTNPWYTKFMVYETAVISFFTVQLFAPYWQFGIRIIDEMQSLRSQAVLAEGQGLHRVVCLRVRVRVRVCVCCVLRASKMNVTLHHL
jgi:hypothetical protein